MPLALVRACALALVVLSVCPFTAPFATLDVSVLYGNGRSVQGALLTAGTNLDESLALPEVAALTSASFVIAAVLPVLHLNRLSKQRLGPTVLRL